ncbi:MAG: SRPBCC family protein [bacterium]
MIKVFAALSVLALSMAHLPLENPIDPVFTEAVVNAPVAKVWKAFTTKEGIESWMVAKTDIELKVDSIWRTSYRNDSTLHDDATIEQQILSFDPERMFSFRTVKTPKGFPWPEAIARTWCVVYFESAAPDKTKVTLRMLGFDRSEESRKMRGFFVAGNQETMDELVKKFANRVSN